MDIFAMIFAVFMIAAAIAATVIMGVFVGFWGALAFGILLVGIYKAFTYESGQERPLRRDELNAFQSPLSDE